jgi:hypothetical protein
MRRPAVPLSRTLAATIAATIAAFALAAPVGAQDTGPVTKPLPSPAGGNRLPAPTGLSVRQDAYGAIILSWAPVEGAVRYNIGRSVGTEGFRQNVPPSTQATTLADVRVTVGIRHLYTVTPIDAQGVSGIRATSEAFIPSRPYNPGATTAPPAPTNVVARVEADGSIFLSWVASVPNGLGRYEVRLNGVVQAVSQSLPQLRVANPPAGSYQYVVTVIDRYGNMSPPASSNTVTIQATAVKDTAATAPGTGGTTTSGIAAEDAGGTVLVNVAAPVTLRVGGTHSLAGVARGGWTSLSPAIASVTADGAVSARAAGVAQLATVGTDATGAVRVTVVRVRVTP